MPNRLERLRKDMLAQNLQLIALTPGPNLYYLTGLSFHFMERPILLLITTEGTLTLLTPELERAKAECSSIALECISYGETEASRLEAFSQLQDIISPEIAKFGVEPTKMRYLELSLLQSTFPEVQISSAEACLDNLRLTKEPGESEACQQAVQIAEAALQETLPLVKMGIAEVDLANELTLQLLRKGSDPELPFSPIVASGPNSALPHATPGDRKLQTGDLVIIDWGAAHKGYLSDLTRTFGVGQVSQELQNIHQAVLQANHAARRIVHPGRLCSEVDLAARQVIHESGYGEFFIHRTGHGLGLEAHEPPYIRSDNPQKLSQGMLFTIEPGVYIPNLGGVRIEDDVLVTSEGGRSLSSLPRELELIA